MVLFETKDLNFWYPDVKTEGAYQENKALADIHFSVNEGEFILLLGSSGSGKTTLLKHLKPQLVPFGKREGCVYYKGKVLQDIPDKESAFEIGYVMQSPDNQIVTDKVWHELAFGMENMGLSQRTMRLRVAELASFFGIQEWYHQNTESLSGGQKQLLNLASIMVMQPRVLLLDEPVSQLDPIAAKDFLQMVKRIQQELGTTVIMSSHNPEDIFALADRIIFMENGQISILGSKPEVTDYLFSQNRELFLPAQLRIFKYLNRHTQGVGNSIKEQVYPMSIPQGREFLQDWLKKNELTKKYKFNINEREFNENEIVLLVKNLYFTYDRKSSDIIRNLTLQINKGEFLCLLGGNGSGKSTLLKIMAGVLRPVSGRVRVLNHLKIAMLCQNPQSLFTEDEVEKDIWYVLDKEERKSEHKKELFQQICRQLDLDKLKRKHPYDLSGGEQQRAAIAKLLLTEPDILLLDEPCKGLDGEMKRELARFFKELTCKGVTIIMVSHDIEFCACYAERCALLFDGEIVSIGETHNFFLNNTFYTTAVNRMCRNILDLVVTVDDVEQMLGDSRLNASYIEQEKI